MRFPCLTTILLLQCNVGLVYDFMLAGLRRDDVADLLVPLLVALALAGTLLPFLARDAFLPLVPLATLVT